jgi:hypothetical protein
MTSEGFRHLIEEQTDEELLGPCLRDEIIPYAFDLRPAAWDTFRAELAALLGVSRGDITVVGSGRLGYSMKPWNDLVTFRDSSDIDIAVVNADLFDELWLSLLSVAYPRPPITDKLGGWLKERRKEVYTGWITPPEIHLDWRIFGAKAKPVLKLRTRWFNALQQVSRHPPRRHEGIEGRLYRTWRHAELYHLNGFAALRQSLTG